MRKNKIFKQTWYLTLFIIAKKRKKKKENQLRPQLPAQNHLHFPVSPMPGVGYP